MVTPVRVTLKAGTEIIVNGVTVCLAGDAVVDGAQGDYTALRECSTAGPLVEYPKMLHDGYIAQNAEDEASHARPSPLKDVTVAMDNPAFDAQPEPTPERLTADEALALKQTEDLGGVEHGFHYTTKKK